MLGAVLLALLPMAGLGLLPVVKAVPALLQETFNWVHGPALLQETFPWSLLALIVLFGALAAIAAAGIRAYVALLFGFNKGMKRRMIWFYALLGLNLCLLVIILFCIAGKNPDDPTLVFSWQEQSLVFGMFLLPLTATLLTPPCPPGE